MKSPRNLGIALLAVWLILFGLLTQSFRPVTFRHSQNILALLALGTGIVLLARR
jgi:hypothetical protein